MPVSNLAYRVLIVSGAVSSCQIPNASHAIADFGLLVQSADEKLRHVFVAYGTRESGY